MRREDWREIDSVSRSAGWRIFVWTVVFVVAALVIGGGVWAFKVVTSDVKGRGDAEIITNDGRNRINSQEWFEGQYRLVISTDLRLDGLASDLKANVGKPDEMFYRTNLTGTQNMCIQFREMYNAEARKMSRGQWRSPDLPYELTDADPQTDCQPKKMEGSTAP